MDGSGNFVEHSLATAFDTGTTFSFQSLQYLQTLHGIVDSCFLQFACQVIKIALHKLCVLQCFHVVICLFTTNLYST